MFPVFCIGFIMDLTTRNQRKKYSTPSLNIAVTKDSYAAFLKIKKTKYEKMITFRKQFFFYTKNWYIRFKNVISH